MGYRDDFYMVQYIIGYTGNLNDFPTVYFIKGKEFGHITQKHDESQNVGRMEVYASDGYTIGNKMVEKIRGKVMHTSRSTLTKVDVFAPAEKETVTLLAQSIYGTNRGEKYISGWSRQDFKNIDATRAKMAKVLEELPKAT
ncbi:hypothetical protein [Viridibacterium curvum]|uniref:Uncharacterized protein n=1 Tax=Viridibacterium curvum TaxID=1101404 RepID=A0ABP9QNV4_9RHOO